MGPEDREGVSPQFLCETLNEQEQQFLELIEAGQGVIQGDELTITISVLIGHRDAPRIGVEPSRLARSTMIIDPCRAGGIDPCQADEASD